MRSSGFRFAYLFFCCLLPFMMAGCLSKKQPPAKAGLPASYAGLQASRVLPIYPGDLLAPSTADMKLVLDQKGFPNLRVRGFVVFKPAASFRLEVDGAIGSGTALACDGRLLTMINSYDHVYNAFPASNLAASGIIPVPLDCSDLAALLQGFLPSAATGAKVSFDRYHGTLDAIFSYRGYYWRAVLLPQENLPARLQLVELRKNRRADPVATVLLSAYADTAVGIRPLQGELAASETKVKTTIKFADYGASTPDADIFVLTKPHGY